MADESSQTPDNAPPAADPQSIEGLFLQALGQSPQDRQKFLDEACGDDAERRRRIEALLRAYEDAGSFLEKPPAGVGTTATVSLEFLTPSEDPSLLGMLGPYEVYEMLGRGGMGIVFRARDPKLNRVVAIKVLAPELAANPNARRRFLREAQAAAAISHPHVVTIHAVDEGSPASTIPDAPSIRDGSALPYLVMECIVGQTLQQKLDKRGSLRLMEILRIGHQTAQGLAAAHKQGLIHRDIKPANILLENGVERVKITDFGLARAADDISITRTGEVSGTPQYMSPEQASGGTIDHRSDLFSLGCVLYAMCTGRSPFRATTLAAAIRRVCDDTPRPIEEINPEAPHWLIEIVNRLLEKDPDQRIQSADEVADLLGDHLAGVQHPFGRRADTSTGRLDSPVPRRRDAASHAVIESSAVAVPLTMPSVKARVTVWTGALLLLVPLFVWLIAMALDDHPQQRHNAGEMAFALSLFCLPAGLLAIGFGSIYLLNRRSPLGNTLFIAICVLMGPIGILLYLIRHHHLQEVGDGREAQPPSRVGGGREPAAQKPSEVPQWLLTPLPGPVKLLALLLGLIAAVVMGQAIEQWSDVDEAAGTFLFINAAVLGLLAGWMAVAAGVRFDAAKGLLLAVAAIGLMFLGAQAPDREFKQELARFVQRSEAIAWITGGVVLMAAWIAYCVYAATRGPGDGRSSGERLGRGLVIGGVGIWALLAAWMLGVAAEIVPPPAFAHRDLVSVVTMGAVVVGGFLFGVGMILSRWVVTPGMVRQFSDATQPWSSEKGTVPARAVSGGGTSPWRVLGWMIVGGLVVVPSCLILVLGVPYLAQARSDIGVVQIEFDKARPITWVAARGDIGAARADQRTIEQVVTSNPYDFPLPAGVYDLTITYQADGTTGTFGQRVQVEPGQTKKLDVRQNIAVAHQLQHLDKPQVEDDYPPPRKIRLSGDALPDTRTAAAQGEGRVIVRFDDPGLVVRFQTTDEEPDDVAVEFSQGRQTPVMRNDSYRIDAGTYDVAVFDQWAGWKPTQVHPYEDGPRVNAERITVKPGEIVPIRIHRDLQALADAHPDWKGEGFNTFYWGAGWQKTGENFQSLLPITYDLTRSQALVVQQLLLGRASGKPDVPGSRLLDQSLQSPEPAEWTLKDAAEVDQRLAALFSEGLHPAWGKLVVKGETPGTYRLSELTGVVDNYMWSREPSPDAGPGASLLQRPGTSGLSVPSDTPQVNIDVTIADAGLRVLFEQLTTESRRTIPRGKVLDESGTISLTPATYQVIVEDELAGWMTKTDEGEPGPVRYLDSMLDVQPDQPAEVHVASISRNFHKMAATFPRGINRGTHFFRWQGQTYKLSGEQAPIVAFLLKAYADGEPDLHEARLLRGGTFRGNEIDLPPLTSTKAEELLATFREEGHSLKALFDDGEHPAWGTLIMEGAKPNTYRLAELGPEMPSSDNDRAQVNIAFEDQGLRAEFFRFKEGTRNAVRTGESAAEDTTLFLQPGRYRVHVKDDMVGWRIPTPEGGSEPYGYSYAHVTVSSEEPTDLVITRNLQKRVAYYGNPNLETGGKSFRWNAETFKLSQEQAIAVLRLLKAYTRDLGGADVHEGALLRPAKVASNYLADFPMTPREADEYLQRMTAEGRSLKGIFDDGEHPAWGTLVVEGEKPNTYRLSELTVEPAAKGASMPSADAASVAGLAINVEDEGLIARIFSADTDEPRQPLHEITESAVVTLPHGRYDVWVEDRLAGWHRLNSEGEPGPVQYEYDRLRVTPRERAASEDSGRRSFLAGETTSLPVSRNLHKMAAGLVPQHGRPQKFRWQEQSYDLTQKQWPVVAILLQAYADGEPDVHEAQLLSGASFRDAALTLNPLIRSDADEALAVLRESGQSLKSRFDDGEHPAWGTVIVAGETPNTYRLAALQAAADDAPAEPADNSADGGEAVGQELR